MKNLFKKFKFWLPVIYILVLLIDLEKMLDITDYQILVMFTSPLGWFSYFQHTSKLYLVIISSLIILFLIGLGIDLLIRKIK